MAIEKETACDVFPYATDCLFGSVTICMVGAGVNSRDVPRRIATVMCGVTDCATGFLVKLSEAGTPLLSVEDVTNAGMFCIYAGNLSQEASDQL